MNKKLKLKNRSIVTSPLLYTLLGHTLVYQNSLSIYQSVLTDNILLWWSKQYFIGIIFFISNILLQKGLPNLIELNPSP